MLHANITKYTDTVNIMMAVVIIIVMMMMAATITNYDKVQDSKGVDCDLSLWRSVGNSED